MGKATQWSVANKCAEVFALATMVVVHYSNAPLLHFSVTPGSQILPSLDLFRPTVERPRGPGDLEFKNSEAEVCRF
jgi:hypothetical protein